MCSNLFLLWWFITVDYYLNPSGHRQSPRCSDNQTVKQETLLHTKSMGKQHVEVTTRYVNVLILQILMKFMTKSVLDIIFNPT